MSREPRSYKGRTVLALIPARAGSKSVPAKNKRVLGGVPLIAHTIEAAKRSAYVSAVVVTTDDDEIIQIAARLGVPVPFKRPSELAQDSSTGLSVVQHAITFLEGRGEIFDYVAILQPTSPLRTAQDIDACIARIVDTGADSVMSMVELVDFSLKKLKRIEDDVILPLLEPEGKTTAPRQDAPSLYKRNCAIYLTKTELIMEGDLFGRVSRPYIMPPERSVDINTVSDFKLAEFYMARR